MLGFQLAYFTRGLILPSHKDEELYQTPGKDVVLEISPEHYTSLGQPRDPYRPSFSEILFSFDDECVTPKYTSIRCIILDM